MKNPKFFSKVIFLFINVILSLGANKIYAQTSKEFWFAAPELAAGYDSPIYLRVTTLDSSATVTISEPANTGFATITQTIPATSNYTFDLSAFIADVQSSGADVVDNKGILITSTQNILAYYEVARSDNPEIFALKGTNALGTSFIVPSMKAFLAGGYGAHKTMFYAVATDSNTTINVTPSVDLVGHNMVDGSFTVMLNKGEVYCAEAASSTDHIGGTAVTSDKPLAITYDADLTVISFCADLDGDQIIPVSLAGDKFITLPGYLTGIGGSDFDFIFPTQDNTRITINGVDSGMRNRGEYLQRASNNETLLIETDKPVILYQVSGISCEIGGGVVPQINCTGSTIVGVTRSSSNNFYLNLLVRSGGEGSFTFNGDASIITAADFTDVPFTLGDWKYARKLIDNVTLLADSGAIIRNSTPFHLGMVQAGNGGGTYGYFSNFNPFKPEVAFTNDAMVCQSVNDTSVLSTSFVGTGYQWNKDGVSIPGATDSIYTARTPGVYNVTITYNSLCGQSTSSDIKVSSNCALPLHFLSFNAQNKSGQNTLLWETANEIGVSYFEMERSTDGISFIKIGSVKANNTSGNNSYSFIDAAAFEQNNFYRIKELDRNGYINYSSVIKLTSKPGFTLSLYPNPAMGTINIEARMAGTQLKISIYNSTGVLIESKKVANQAKFIVPVYHLASGIYWVELSNEKENRRAQFRKL